MPRGDPEVRAKSKTRKGAAPPKPPKSRSTTGKSPAELAQRDAVIAELWAQDIPIEEIGRRVGLGTRQVRNRYAVWCEHNQGILEGDGLGLVQHMVAGIHSSIGRFELIAEEATSPASKVHAMKAANEARNQVVLAAQAVGKLPRDLSGLRDGYEITEIFRVFGEALEEMEADDVRDELLARLSHLLPAEAKASLAGK